jgi:hypothetical protein
MNRQKILGTQYQPPIFLVRNPPLSEYGSSQKDEGRRSRGLKHFAIASKVRKSLDATMVIVHSGTSWKLRNELTLLKIYKIQKGIEMKNFARYCLICIVLGILFSGCASTNVSQMVNRRLDPEMLNSKLDTQTIDLSIGSKCQETKSVKIANGESRTDEYCIDHLNGGCRWYIIPKDFTNDIVRYIENRLSAGNIKVGSGSDIIVSLEELKSQEGFWTFGSSCKIKVQIPDINYTQTYVGESGGPLGDYAAAYAIHLAVENFLKDPVLQSYLKCSTSGFHVLYKKSGPDTGDMNRSSD